MINFNVPPFIGTEMDYIKKAVENKKFVEMESLTKKCNAWLEGKDENRLKHFSQHHVHMQLRWLPFYAILKKAMR